MLRCRRGLPRARSSWGQPQPPARSKRSRPPRPSPHHAATMSEEAARWAPSLLRLAYVVGWRIDPLFTHRARVSGSGQQIAGERILVDKIFARRRARILDGNALEPFRPFLDIGDGHAGGKAPAIVTRHARLAVGGVNELGGVRGGGAVGVLVIIAVLAQA